MENHQAEKPHKIAAVKIIRGSKKRMTMNKRKRKKLQYKETPPSERQCILRSQQRGSASLRITKAMGDFWSKTRRKSKMKMASNLVPAAISW